MDMRLLGQYDGWNSASSNERRAFIKAMKGRQFGQEETLGAWQFFHDGYLSGLWASRQGLDSRGPDDQTAPQAQERVSYDHS